MIQLCLVLVIQATLLLAIGDLHILMLGAMALAVGSVAGLVSSGTIKTVRSRLTALTSSIVRQNRFMFHTAAGNRVIMVLILPAELKSQLELLAAVTQTTINTLVVDAIRDRIWFALFVDTSKMPTID
jgi:hypothetical protein